MIPRYSMLLACRAMEYVPVIDIILQLTADLCHNIYKIDLANRTHPHLVPTTPLLQ